MGIQWIQVDVGEEVGRLVPEGQSAHALKGSEEVVDRKVGRCFRLRVRGGDNACGQLERWLALRRARQ